MSTEQLHRDLGRLESKVDGIDSRVAAIEGKLDAVLSRQYRFAGAVSVLSALVSFGAAWLLK